MKLCSLADLQTNADRQTDRGTDRQTDRGTDRQTDREIFAILKLLSELKIVLEPMEFHHRMFVKGFEYIIRINTRKEIYFQA